MRNAPSKPELFDYVCEDCALRLIAPRMDVWCRCGKRCTPIERPDSTQSTPDEVEP
jgi:hypothetical protein